MVQLPQSNPNPFVVDVALLCLEGVLSIDHCASRARRQSAFRRSCPQIQAWGWLTKPPGWVPSRRMVTMSATAQIIIARKPHKPYSERCHGIFEYCGCLEGLTHLGQRSIFG